MCLSQFTYFHVRWNSDLFVKLTVTNEVFIPIYFIYDLMSSIYENSSPVDCPESAFTVKNNGIQTGTIGNLRMKRMQ